MIPRGRLGGSAEREGNGNGRGSGEKGGNGYLNFAGFFSM
jgi:hypothetical protein